MLFRSCQQCPSMRARAVCLPLDVTAVLQAGKMWQAFIQKLLLLLLLLNDPSEGCWLKSCCHSLASSLLRNTSAER